MKTYKIPESVLVVIYSSELDVLLIERAGNPGFWQSVTGSRATPQESLFETAVREVGEETGIRVISSGMTAENEVSQDNLHDWQVTNRYEIYPSWRYRYEPGVTMNTEHVFGLCVPRDIQILLEPREHLRYVWLPYLEAADRCFSSSNAEAILQLPRRIRPT
ncbi:dihydroneopterin triphosphate diphosphatase [Oxalobacter sp. OttesenSCG-928-P03]|nr:dihydroneopterin triphosphate diphosphatase [Oxalobacter sp. OttesenSCG-928-P03]